MRYISRDENNLITGSFSMKQYEGQESLQDDDAELLDFSNKQGAYEPGRAAKRRKMYLPMPDQLDMQYWDLVNDTTSWQDHVALVKSTHP